MISCLEVLRVLLRVVHVHRQQAHAEAGPVLHQDLAVAVVDDAAGASTLTSRVRLFCGRRPRTVAGEDLQEPQAEGQHAEEGEGDDQQDADPDADERVVFGRALLPDRLQDHSSPPPSRRLEMRGREQADAHEEHVERSGDQAVEDGLREHLRPDHGEEAALRTHDVLEEPEEELGEEGGDAGQQGDAPGAHGAEPGDEHAHEVARQHVDERPHAERLEVGDVGDQARRRSRRRRPRGTPGSPPR